MSSITENSDVIEIKVGGKELKAKKLNIGFLLGHFQKIVKDEKEADMYKVASNLEGTDKIDFLIRAFEIIPSGNDLTLLAGSKAECLDGKKEILFMSTKELNDGIESPDYFNELIKIDDIELLDTIINRISGIEEVKKNTKIKKKVKV